MVNKKGDYKWDIMLSLILGLLILSLSLYFIFNEYFTSEDMEWEICRQSIQVRSTLPELTIAKFDGPSFKDEFPLKCKTRVIEIDKNDVTPDKDGRMEIETKIAETMAECWALYDKGDASAFPSKFFKSSTCVPCARIHLTPEAKEKLGDKTINIRNALDLPMTPKYSYYVYLRDSGKKFAAFDFGNGIPFNLYGEKFEIKKTEKFYGIEFVDLKNKLTGGEFEAYMKTINISLPETFSAKDGDLLINYGIASMGKDPFGKYVPYLFYFQTNQKDDPFTEVRKSFILDLSYGSLTQYWGYIKNSILGEQWKHFETYKESVDNANIGFCETWEGIPA
ncbi:hypothetical protein K8R30_03295 [archaeon]|nr:hypothetical protein [archaeon]